MNKSLFILFLLAVLPSVQSCKKKEASEPTAKELITRDDWTWVRFEFYDNNGNLTSETEPHTKWVFAPSGDYYIYDLGGTIYRYGTWQLLDNDTKLRLIEHSGSYDYTFEIDALSENKFTITYTVSTGHGSYYFER